MRIAEPQQVAAQPVHQLRDALLGVRQEIGELDLLGLDALDVGEDDLECALEELHLAGGVEEVAGVEAARNVLAGVPEASGDAAGAVAEFEQQIWCAVSVGAQLFVGDEVNSSRFSPSRS